MTSLPAAPLRNKRVLVACSARKSEDLVNRLESLGAEVLPLKVITISEISDKSSVRSALSELDIYSWIIFTSSYGVLFFNRYMNEEGVPDVRRRRLQVCAVGPATAATARECGFAVSLVPEEYVAEGVLHALATRHGGLQRLAGMRILLPRAKEARDVLPRELSAAGARVDVVPCYETTLGEIDDEVLRLIRQRKPDLLVFTSSSTVKNFVALLSYEEEGRKILSQATVAALGPVTAQTVESYGKNCDIIPEENTIPSLLTAIRKYFGP